MFDMQRKCQGLQQTLAEQQHQIYADRQRTYTDTVHRLQSQLHSARSHVQKELSFEHCLLQGVGAVVFPPIDPLPITPVSLPLSGKTTTRPTTFESSSDDFQDTI